MSEAKEKMETWDATLNFSTEEQVVGTWIDGKPLYQKTVDFAPDARVYRVAHGISNLNKIIDCSGSYSLSDSIWFVIPRSELSGNTWSILFGDITSTYVEIAIGDNVSLNRTGFLTLQYTKTTD